MGAKGPGPWAGPFTLCDPKRTAPLATAQFLRGGGVETAAAVPKLFPGDPGQSGRAQKCSRGPRGGEVAAKPRAPSQQSKSVHVRFSEQMNSAAENKFEKQWSTMVFFWL